jgi:hypothetical protein
MQSDIKTYERTLLRKNQYDEKSKDPIERVKGRIEAICIDNDIYNYKDIEELSDIIDQLEYNKRQYINPAAFIFGYYVITNKNIDKKKIDEVFNKYNFILQKNGVEKVDIIRYARFWLFTILNIEEPKKTKYISSDEEIEEYIDDENGGAEEQKNQESEEDFEEYYDDEW